MERVARLAMSGPLAAVTTTLFFLLLGFLFAPFFVVSSALVALVSLRQGLKEAIKVAFCALVLYYGFSVLAFNQNSSGLIFPIFMWFPLILLSFPLRQSGNYQISFMLVALLVSLYALLFRYAVGDLQGFWVNKVEAVVDIIAAEAALELSLAQIQYLSGQIHIWWLILLECTLIVTLFLARYWQSKLYNPLGFAEEFRKIQLSKSWLWFFLIVIGLNVIQRSSGVELPVSGDLLAILLVLFSLQGLSVVHYRNKTQGLSVAWLVGLYVFLFLVPQVVGLILAITGLADVLSDFRSLRNAPKEGED